MRVLLAVKSKKMETLGPMYLSAVAKQAGHECRIVEFKDVLAEEKKWKPDIVGFSVMTGNQVMVKDIAREIKTRNNPPVIIAGGPHATFFPEDFGDDFNIVFKGEAEQGFAELLGSPAKYPNLDSIPYPDRTDFPNMKIRDFIASRGCPGACNYCYSDRWAKMFPEIPRVRLRSVKSVIEEICDIEGMEFVYFQDSCFGTSMKWLKEFSPKYRSRVNIPFHCHLRPSQVTEERVLLLHDAGCFSVRIALEAASTRLRKLLNRTDVTLESAREAARFLKKWNIRLMIQNMIGLPTATIEEDLETLEVNVLCQPAYGWCSIFSPYPGTNLGDYCKEKGFYTGDYSDITESFFDTSFLNIPKEHKEQLECLQKVFALCVEARYLPKVEELTHGNFKSLVHKIMRKVGDGRLYNGVI